MMQNNLQWSFNMIQPLGRWRMYSVACDNGVFYFSRPISVDFYASMSACECSHASIHTECIVIDFDFDRFLAPPTWPFFFFHKKK